MGHFLDEFMQKILAVIFVICIIALTVIVTLLIVKREPDEQQSSTSYSYKETIQAVEQSQSGISLEKPEESTIEVTKDSYEEVKEALDTFLESYYTYDSYGQNYEDYKASILPEVRESWKARIDKDINNLNMAAMVKSEYVSSQFFVSNPTFEESQVICRIRNNFDQLDGKGNFVGLVENKTDIMITVKRQGESLYVKEIKGIRITE